MRMRGEIDPQIAAQEYEDQLNAIATGRGEPIYQHDLILLGLGDDGHTASLFPGTAALDEMTRRVVANFVPKLNAWRLTFTFPLINHARHILFLVGASKSPQLIERVLAGDRQFPAARVNPSAGEVTWMIGGVVAQDHPACRLSGVSRVPNCSADSRRLVRPRKPGWLCYGNMMRTIIVTGSAGLIGSETVRRFARDGARVLGIDNDMRAEFFGAEASTKKTRDDLIANFRDYEHHDMDIRDAAAVMDLFKQHRGTIEAIVHTASQPSHDWAARDPQTDFTVNANGTLNLLEAARKFSPEAPFIFTSTNKVYGDTPNGLPLRELEKRWEIEPGHEYEPGISETMSIDYTKHSLFGASKVAADILVQEYGRYFGMPTVSFRGGCLTGPAHAGTELHGFLSYLMICAVSGRPYRVFGYKGKQVRDNIHSFDLVEAFARIHSRPARWRGLQHRGQPAQQLFHARSHRNVRTDQRQKVKLELRGNQSHRRPHLVDQRCAKVPGALSKLEISLRDARNPRRNSRRACRIICPQITQILHTTSAGRIPSEFEGSLDHLLIRSICTNSDRGNLRIN